MIKKPELLVTVLFGKQSTRFSVPADDPRALDIVKLHIYNEFQLESKFQRLVLRGRDVKSATALTNNCKLLVLRNRAYREKNRASKQDETTFTDSSEPPRFSVESSDSHRAPTIDVSELQDNTLLVQVFRGKARYDFIFPCSETVIDVKIKISRVLGLDSPQSLKLVIKGATPSDDTVLGTLVGNKKLVKAMALLQAHQHVLQEKQEELRELLNDLASAQVALQRIQRQMARNFSSKDEILFELSRILGEGQQIESNLDLIKQHLATAKCSRLRTSEDRLATVTHAIHESKTMQEVVQRLLETQMSL
ncbi:hypothetical protein CCR75_003048 [Bremia lactucae]|uniref:Ubiquitin-like domain-containing protein n=1 Tax=Bremia lactucae TaxID=4779 RepID=A0A976ILW5_BRELC|nr:hypothetical protein CCR75_003048 [Bremia lactucae]